MHQPCSNSSKFNSFTDYDDDDDSDTYSDPIVDGNGQGSKSTVEGGACQALAVSKTVKARLRQPVVSCLSDGTSELAYEDE